MAERKTVLSINKPTPSWANWLFRVVFLLNKVVVAIVAADPGIDDQTKVRIGLYLSGLDTLCWSISRMLGVKIQEDESKKE